MTRVVPYVFEDPDWRAFFWSEIPEGQGASAGGDGGGEQSMPLAQVMLNAVCDLVSGMYIGTQHIVFSTELPPL